MNRSLIFVRCLGRITSLISPQKWRNLPSYSAFHRTISFDNDASGHDASDHGHGAPGHDKKSQEKKEIFAEDKKDSKKDKTDDYMKKLLLHEVAKLPPKARSKVTVVGSGKVGATLAFTLLLRGIVNDIAIVSQEAKQAEGEVLDLQHASVFMKNARIIGGLDFSISAGSQICVITPGTIYKKDERRGDLVKRNTEFMKKVIPELLKHSPETIILVVSEPVDVMTYIAWKLSKLPPHRVMGAGTTLDSARLRFLIAERLGVSPGAVNAWVLGERGKNCLALWSSVNVAGVRLHDVDDKIGTHEDPEKWDDLRVLSNKSEQGITKLKGSVCYGLGLSASMIVQSILSSADIVLPVSTLAKGFHGIDQDVFLSLACVLSKGGVSHVVNLKLSDTEKCILQCSAEEMRKEIDKLSIGK